MCNHLEYVIENGNKWCVDCGTALGQPFELEKELTIIESEVQ